MFHGPDERPEVSRLLDDGEAAETLGKTRSSFMLEAACREADAVLLDRRFFLPDEKAYGP